MTGDLSSVNASVTDLREKVFSVNDSQTETLDMIDLKLDSVSDILRQEHSDTKLESSNTMKMMSVNSEFEENVIEDLQKTYNLLKAHVDRYTCGGEGDWRRVVYLNMTDPNTDCPSGWQLIESPKRTCGRPSTFSLTCYSVFFPVLGGDYTRVCGTVKAYQYGPTDGFESYDDGQATSIDEAYVSGVSLTHGDPRQHIWTFVAGVTEYQPLLDDACPCDATISIATPPFVGGDYFCESGVNSGSYIGFHADDPLWDGEDCNSFSTCCEFNNPPYFNKQLSHATSANIEARICQKDANDDNPIEFIELYVK